MNHHDNFINYSELNSYLENSNETETTFHSLSRILKREFRRFDMSSTFCMFDVGSSDGQLTMPLADHLRKRIPKLHLLAIEPEKPAMKKFQKRIQGKDKYFAQLSNQTIQEFFLTNTEKRKIFNLILFSQCWYHFPREEWRSLFQNAFTLLRRNGIIMIVLDSHFGQIYKLKDLITKGKADTLEYGDLHSAEDMEGFLTSLDVKHSTIRFPIYVAIKNREKRLEEFARQLAFIYRTSPHRILPKYENEVRDLLEENRKGNAYRVENIVKVITVREHEQSPLVRMAKSAGLGTRRNVS